MRLLYSTRSPSGQRVCGDRAVERVIPIQQLYSAGLSSKTLDELLPCIESPVEKYAPVLLGRFAEQRDRIDTQIAELIQTRDRLDLVINASTTF